MKQLTCLLFVLSVFSPVAQASECTLECDAKMCDVVFPNGVVFATYEKNYTSPATRPSQKPSAVEVEISRDDQKADLENLLTLCALKSHK